MSKRFEIPMFKPRSRPKFKREGSNVVAYYKDDLSSVRQAIAEQWTDAPLSGKVALEAEFRVVPSKRVSKAVREAMLAGEIRPSGQNCDGLLRALMDAMSGIVFGDERQVTRLSGIVSYGETPGATLWVGEARLLFSVPPLPQEIAPCAC